MTARTRIAVAGLAAGTLLGAPSVAGASPDYTGTQTSVNGESFTRPVEVEGVTVSRDSGGLPVTGGDVAGLAAIGFGAVAVGAVLVRRGRTRAATA